MNKHLIHLEDLILTEGELGLQKVNRVFSALVRGDTSKFTVKYDGAPAILFGTDPNDGKKFVATKSIFNKKPIILKTQEDIDSYIKYPDLREKLYACLRYLPQVTGVVQADLLFTHSDVKISNSPNVKSYVSFISNIIQYDYLLTCENGLKIARAYLGIVPHTYYSISEDLKLMMIEPFDVEYDHAVYVQDVAWKLDYWPDLKDVPMNFDMIDTTIKTSDMNKFFREEYQPNFWKQSLTHRLYFEIMNHKNSLLNFANTFATDFFQTEQKINGRTVGHEGLVYKDEDIFCKLVNRNVFARANFSSSTQRGFSL